MREYSDGNPAISVYIFPNCKDPGMIETLCYNSVKQNDNTECVESFEKCLNNNSIPIKNSHKMRLNAYLSYCSNGESVGVAGLKGIIKLETDAFSDVIKILESV